MRQSTSDAIRRFYPDDAKDLRLEEVIWDDLTSHWRITISFLRFPQREYKEVEVSGPGEIAAMRIRQLT